MILWLISNFFELVYFILTLQINLHNALVLTVPKYKFENATIMRYDTHYHFINPYRYNPLSNMRLELVAKSSFRLTSRWVSSNL